MTVARLIHSKSDVRKPSTRPENITNLNNINNIESYFDQLDKGISTELRKQRLKRDLNFEKDAKRRNKFEKLKRDRFGKSLADKKFSLDMMSDFSSLSDEEEYRKRMDEIDQDASRVLSRGSTKPRIKPSHQYATIPVLEKTSSTKMPPTLTASMARNEKRKGAGNRTSDTAGVNQIDALNELKKQRELEQELENDLRFFKDLEDSRNAEEQADYFDVITRRLDNYEERLRLEEEQDQVEERALKAKSSLNALDPLSMDRQTSNRLLRPTSGGGKRLLSGKGQKKPSGVSHSTISPEKNYTTAPTPTDMINVRNAFNLDHEENDIYDHNQITKDNFFTEFDKTNQHKKSVQRSKSDAAMVRGAATGGRPKKFTTAKTSPLDEAIEKNPGASVHAQLLSEKIPRKNGAVALPSSSTSVIPTPVLKPSISNQLKKAGLLKESVATTASKASGISNLITTMIPTPPVPIQIQRTIPMNELRTFRKEARSNLKEFSSILKKELLPIEKRESHESYMEIVKVAGRVGSTIGSTTGDTVMNGDNNGDSRSDLRPSLQSDARSHVHSNADGVSVASSSRNSSRSGSRAGSNVDMISGSGSNLSRAGSSFTSRLDSSSSTATGMKKSNTGVSGASGIPSTTAPSPFDVVSRSGETSQSVEVGSQSDLVSQEDMMARLDKLLSQREEVAEESKSNGGSASNVSTQPLSQVTSQAASQKGSHMPSPTESVDPSEPMRDPEERAITRVYPSVMSYGRHSQEEQTQKSNKPLHPQSTISKKPHTPIVIDKDLLVPSPLLDPDIDGLLGLRPEDENAGVYEDNDDFGTNYASIHASNAGSISNSLHASRVSSAKQNRAISNATAILNNNGSQKEPTAEEVITPHYNLASTAAFDKFNERFGPYVGRPNTSPSKMGGTGPITGLSNNFRKMVKSNSRPQSSCLDIRNLDVRALDHVADIERVLAESKNDTKDLSANILMRLNSGGPRSVSGKKSTGGKSKNCDKYKKEIDQENTDNSADNSDDGLDLPLHMIADIELLPPSMREKVLKKMQKPDSTIVDTKNAIKGMIKEELFRESTPLDEIMNDLTTKRNKVYSLGSVPLSRPNNSGPMRRGGGFRE